MTAIGTPSSLIHVHTSAHEAARELAGAFAQVYSQDVLGPLLALRAEWHGAWYRLAGVCEAPTSDRARAVSSSASTTRSPDPGAITSALVAVAQCIQRLHSIVQESGPFMTARDLVRCSYGLPKLPIDRLRAVHNDPLIVDPDVKLAGAILLAAVESPESIGRDSQGLLASGLWTAPLVEWLATFGALLSTALPDDRPRAGEDTLGATRSIEFARVKLLLTDWLPCASDPSFQASGLDMCDDWDDRLATHDSCQEPADAGVSAARAPAGSGDTSQPHRLEPVKSTGSSKGRCTVAEANRRAKELLLRSPTGFLRLSKRRKAVKIGCHIETWGKTELFKALQRQSDSSRGSTIGKPAVRFPAGQEALIGYGKPNEVLIALIEEQERDHEPSPLEPISVGGPERPVRNRKTV